MSTTWTDIFPDVDGPPVRGVPGDFSAASAAFGRMAVDAQYVLDEFARITADGDISQLRGQAATAFERFVHEVADSLGDLPRVSHEAASAFDGHAVSLESIVDEAGIALARARTAWDRKNELEHQLDSSRQRADRLQSQIDAMPPDADPGAAAQLGGDHQDAMHALAAVRADLDDARQDLAAQRSEWSDLRAREADLRDTTRSRLDDIDLGDLKDPGRLQSFVEGACQVIAAFSLVDECLELVDAMLRGDWAAVLWQLREALDVVLLVGAVVLLFVPGVNILMVGLLALAVAKLAIDAALYATKWPDPESGQVINGADLMMDAIDVVTAGKGAAAVRAGRGGVPLARQITLSGEFRTSASISRRAEIASELGIGYTRRTTVTALLFSAGGRRGLAVRTSDSLTLDSASLNSFQRALATDTIDAGKTIFDGATETVPNMYDGDLSTDVFPSIRDGHGANDTSATDVIVHVMPAPAAIVAKPVLNEVTR
jgi:hypothetical protein